MKSFSELTSASQVNNGDLLAISQTSGSGYASKKTTVKEIADKSNLNLAEEYDSTSTYAVDDYVIYESVLYKCISATTGTFDSTKWTSVVVTDEMGSGGGGGTGGHTIIDENGNSMTARAGLQFFGAVGVRDDNANNRTLVEVLGGDFYNPIIYSTTEREIGVWTDGKPLYEKTIIDTLPSSATSKNIPLNISNIDKIVSLKGIAIRSDGAVTQIEHAREDDTIWSMITGAKTELAINIKDSSYINQPVYFTIQYTKTTDVAGSGSWTPQGVPTHHYSTDEHIVGTWIDGSTIYEKTIPIQKSSISSGNNTINHLINNFGQLVKKEIIYNYSNGDMNTDLANPSNNDYRMEVGDVGSTDFTLFIGTSAFSLISVIYATLRYTKTS